MRHSIFKSISSYLIKGSNSKSLSSYHSENKIEPVSRVFGIDRGLPIDRYYIENFLNSNRQDISGKVLEIGDPIYTKKFGDRRVSTSDVLHAVTGNPKATIVGNLSTGEGIPENAYDCMIITQTFHVIYNFKEAIRTCKSCLKPQGVLLATLPGISQISRYDMDRWGDFWRFTSLSAKTVFGEIFGGKNVSVRTYGNVATATSFLQGLASEDLEQEQLDYEDEDYQVLIAVRAVK